MAVIAGSLGNLAENFEGAVFGFLLPYISSQFFPSDEPATAILLSAAAYAVGFFMKPAGAMWFGSMGDRYGRRSALFLSILMLGAAGLATALCPGYQTIGVLAPIALVLMRLVGGFATGGEFGLSAAYLVEFAPNGRRAFVGCTQQVTVIAGTLLASATVAGLTAMFSDSDMRSWGWRIAFGAASAIAVASALLRILVPDTPSFQQVEARKEKVTHPVREVLRRYPAASLRVAGLSIGGIVTYYIWMQFLPSFAHASTGISLSSAQLANTVALVLMLPAIPLWALLSDRWGRRPTLLMFGIGLSVLTYPLLIALHTSEAGYFAAQIGGAMLLAIYMSNGPVVKAEQFPARLRAAGISFPYALSAAIFGGTAPLVTSMFVAVGHPLMLGIYIMIACLISSIVFWRMPETKDIRLED